MLTAIHAPEAVQGVVATVPANVIAASHPPGGPAWLRNGRPLPYADHQQPDDQNPDALIPAERVRGPVLMIAAGADQVWPSAAMARSLSARLHQHGHPHGHTLLDYPRAGHSLGYLIPQLPPGLFPPGITDQPADQAATSQRMALGRRIPPPPAAAAVSRNCPAAPHPAPAANPGTPVIQPSARPEAARDGDAQAALRDGHYSTRGPVRNTGNRIAESVRAGVAGLPRSAAHRSAGSGLDSEAVRLQDRRS
jgi:hypothetical protein